MLPKGGHPVALQCTDFHVILKCWRCCFCVQGMGSIEKLHLKPFKSCTLWCLRWMSSSLLSLWNAFAMWQFHKFSFEHSNHAFSSYCMEPSARLLICRDGVQKHERFFSTRGKTGVSGPECEEKSKYFDPHSSLTSVRYPTETLLLVPLVSTLWF